MSTKCLLLAVLVVGLATPSLSLLASDLPVVRQPSDPALAATDRAALAAAWTAIETALRPGFVLSRVVQLSGRQWAEAEYVQFAAGVIQSTGFATSLVTGSWGGAPRTWIVAGVPVSFGMTYIPIEAAPALLASKSWIGQIAWQGGASGTSFDVRYLGFTQAVPVAPNAPPAVNLGVAERYAVVDETTTLMVTGTDPDGALLFFDWLFSDGTRITDPRATLWYTFREVGNATVGVTVFDTLGGKTSLSMVVEVLAERPECGCGD